MWGSRRCSMKARKGARPVPGPTMMSGTRLSSGNRKSGFLDTKTGTVSPTWSPQHSTIHSCMHFCTSSMMMMRGTRLLSSNPKSEFLDTKTGTILTHLVTATQHLSFTHLLVYVLEKIRLRYREWILLNVILTGCAHLP